MRSLLGEGFYRSVSRSIEVELPKGYMNVGVAGGCLIADTNDSANWDTLRFPLPDGEWRIHSQDGKKVRLVR